MAQKNPVKSPAAKRVASTVAKTAGTTKPVARGTAAKAVAKPVIPAVKKSPAAPVKAKVTKLVETGKPTEVDKEKIKKQKLVRDSFTMPEDEYRVLGEVKKACIKAGFEVKKSELLRVGVALIRQMDLPALRNVVEALPPLKAGRPKREK